MNKAESTPENTKGIYTFKCFYGLSDSIAENKTCLVCLAVTQATTVGHPGLGLTCEPNKGISAWHLP